MGVEYEEEKDLERYCKHVPVPRSLGGAQESDLMNETFFNHLLSRERGKVKDNEDNNLSDNQMEMTTVQSPSKLDMSHTERQNLNLKTYIGNSDDEDKEEATRHYSKPKFLI